MRNPYLSTKKKRETIALALEKLAAEHGASSVRRASSYSTRLLNVTISTGAYWVSINLDGNSGNNVFLGNWNTEGKARYPADFGFTINGSVNEYHFGKATTYAGTPEQLCAAIGAGLRRIATL